MNEEWLSHKHEDFLNCHKISSFWNVKLSSFAPSTSSIKLIDSICLFKANTYGTNLGASFIAILVFSRSALKLC